MRLVLLLVLQILCASSIAVASDQRKLSYAGRILKSDGSPLNASTQFRLQVTDAAGTCVLWEETLTSTVKNGIFDVQLGTGTTAFDGSASGQLSSIFAQGKAINCKSSSPSPSVIPAQNDDRNLAVSFNDGSGWQNLNSQIPIKAVPYALSTSALGGAAVDLTGLADGYVLRYNSANNTWIPAMNGSGTGVSALTAGVGISLTGTASAPIVGLSAPVSATNGGTGVSTAANGQVLIGNGSGFSLSTLSQGSGITVTNASGSITISTTGSVAVSNVASLADQKIWIGDSGGVAQEQSLSQDLALANTGAVTVNAIKGTPISAVPTLAGQVLKYNGSTQYSPGFIDVTNVKSSMAGNAQFFPTNCTAGQVLVWQFATDTMACTNAVLPTAGAAGAYVNGGNSFATAATLGTNDSNSLTVQTNASPRMTLDASGNVGIGTTSPSATLDVKGVFRISGSTSGALAFAVPAVAGSAVYTWPSGLPASTRLLQSDSSGNLTWISVPGGGDALMANPLSQFASTTSLQLSGTLSDESGTGAAVFAGTPTLTGVPLAPTAVVDTNTTQLATTAFVVGQAASTGPVMNSIQSFGSSLGYARADHIHPSDTSRLPLAGSASLSTLGTITSGTWNGSVLQPTYGGTGTASLTAGSFVVGNGTSAVTGLAPGTTGNVIYGSSPSTWASGTADVAGLVDKSSAQTITGAKTFSATTKISNQNLLSLGDTGTNSASLRAPTTVTANYTLTWPAALPASNQVLQSSSTGVLSWLTLTSGDALVANPLSQFAATTSTQLAGVLSDETGTGAAVFAASPTMTGVPIAPTAVADTNTTQVATTAFFAGQAGAVGPAMNSVQAVGTSLKFARADHVHPSDTTKSPVAGSASLTTLGTITSGTWNGSILQPTYGGTGQSSLTSGSLLVGNGTAAVNSIAAATTGNILYATSPTAWGSASANTVGLVDKSTAQTISGLKTFNATLGLSNQNLLSLGDTGTNAASLAAPATVTSSYSLTLPPALPAGSRALQSDTSGTMSWVASGVGDALTTNPLSQFASTTSLQLSGDLTDETGTGAAVFGTTPVFTTNISTPMIVGGSTATSSLIYRTTASVGATGADHIFKVGNNGATEALRILNNGTVGVGTASPNAVLQINGAVTGKASILNSTSTVDFGLANLQHTTSSCGAFNLFNMKDGATYTLAIKGTSSGTCSFLAYSDAGSTPLSVRLPPDNGATTTGKMTMYTFIVMGGDVFATWNPGF